jgi:hypothetical protein
MRVAGVLDSEQTPIVEGVRRAHGEVWRNLTCRRGLHSSIRTVHREPYPLDIRRIRRSRPYGEVAHIATADCGRAGANPVSRVLPPVPECVVVSLRLAR